MSDAAVFTENLSKVYKDFWGRDKVRALEGLNLTINRGEVFGLLGVAGAPLEIGEQGRAEPCVQVLLVRPAIRYRPIQAQRILPRL